MFKHVFLFLSYFSNAKISTFITLFSLPLTYMDFLNPATMAKYAAIAAITTHATLRIIPKKGKPSKAPPPKPDDLPQPAPRLKVPSKPTLLVTGGGGLVGTSILRQLTSLGTYNIISIDLFLPPPKSPRHVPQVKYIKANMSDQTAQEMAQLLLHYKVNGIIHTAGVVFMRVRAVKWLAITIYITNNPSTRRRMILTLYETSIIGAAGSSSSLRCTYALAVLPSL